MAFDTSRLLDQIKLKGSIPQGRFSDQEILDVAYDSMLHTIAPFVVSMRENYYVYSADTTLVANQSKYLVPERSVGQSLREVKLIRGNIVYDLDRISLEDVRTTIASTPRGFYLENNSIVLYPTPSAADTLRMFYFMRPSKLVPVTECAQITAIDTGTNTLTVTAPSTWSTSDTFDLIDSKSGYRVLSTDLTASAVSTTSITLSSLSSDLAVGDYVALAGETCFPFIPREYHGLLVHTTIAELLESIGDREGLKIALARVDSIKRDLMTFAATRVEGAPKKIFTPLL